MIDWDTAFSRQLVPDQKSYTQPNIVLEAIGPLSHAFGVSPVIPTAVLTSVLYGSWMSKLV
jgi:hypothetical protein